MLRPRRSARSPIPSPPANDSTLLPIFFTSVESLRFHCNKTFRYHDSKQSCDLRLIAVRFPSGHFGAVLQHASSRPELVERTEYLFRHWHRETVDLFGL